MSLKFTDGISLIRLSIIVSLVSSLETFKIFSLFFFYLGEMKFHSGGLGMCLLFFVFPIYGSVSILFWKNHLPSPWGN